jgi:hypothetical protein
MKAAGTFNGRPRELRHNMQPIYCENRNGATLQTLPLGPRPRGSYGHGASISDAAVRAGRSIAWPFRGLNRNCEF